MTRPVRSTAVLAIAALAAGLAACSHQPGPDPAVSAFLTGWQKGQFASSVHPISADGRALTGADVLAKIKAMSGDLADRKPTLTARKAKVSKNDATAAVQVSWPIASGVTWSYQSTMRLHLSNGVWSPIWEPSLFEPDMKDSDKLALDTTAAPRGAILDGTGAPIVTDRPVVDVGIEPDQVKGDLNALISTLDAAFKSAQVTVDLTDLANRVKAAAPNAFVEVVLLRDDVYQTIRAKIHDLDGTVFHTGTLPLAPNRMFARALLGTVGEVTKERMDASPGKYQMGDQVGFGGLEQAYDDRMRGTPGISVSIKSTNTTAGTGTDQNSGGTTNAKVVFHKDPVAGQPVKTALDQRIQNAADAALSTVTQPSALVAMRISDGSVVAVANGPGSPDNDLALTAQVPPGSMFKTVTTTNLLEAGKITPQTVVDCPPTLTVGGRTFKNSDNEAFGAVQLHVDFAKSCNTAFASLTPQLGPTGLKDTAATLGIGVPWTLGMDAFTGSVSANGDATEQAAAAFGQGTTLVSPIVMASAAAALSRGHFEQPHLLLDPAPAGSAQNGPALKQATVDAMRQMMREVVTDGTATPVKNVPGDPIYGKTGTAEFDNNPADTHSWFMGYRGDIAFAVFIQNGGASTTGAVPVAGKFFTTLG